MVFRNVVKLLGFLKLLVEFHIINVGETSVAMEESGLKADTRRAGALMANTDGLFGASAGKFTRHVTGHGLTTRLSCHTNSEELFPQIHLFS